MGVFVSPDGLAFRCEVQGLGAGAVDCGLVIGGFVVAVAAAWLVVLRLLGCRREESDGGAYRW